jgi:hypothetical protein
MLRHYTPQTQPNAWLLIRELVYEDVRRAHYPEKPSRLHANFLCTSEADILEFKNSYNRVFDIAYEVELLDEKAPSHIGDWTLPNMTNTDTVQVFENRSHLYWRGENIVKHERITLSPVKIVRRIGT